MRKSARLLLPLGMAWIAAMPGANADTIYRHQAADGSVVFSDRAGDTEATAQPQPTIGNRYAPPQRETAPATATGNDTHRRNRQSGPANDTSAGGGRSMISTPASAAMPQRDCQATYGMSCAELDNWRTAAYARCVESGVDHCDDDSYLERRFKPRPLAEIREVAHRAAMRGNRAEANALQELQQMFTDYCAVRVELYCDKATDSKACEKKFGSNCRDDRDIDAVLAKYSELSPSEQARIQQIIKEFGTDQESELTRMFRDILTELLDIAL